MVVLLALTFAAGCERSKEKSLEATSSVQIAVEPLQVNSDTTLVRALPRVDTGGDCAPQYRHGGGGSCVNNSPCRGFGVKDHSGQIVCSCYGDIGGCSALQRCDEKQVRCVSDEEPPFNRTR